ncbi:MAG: DNA polymerase/3'-5' exonuclease PolX [Burkholderiales bacterium]|nr:DNA polymerase/3'-5' exonuclease PolX [Anaerolineae bacterium]
MSLSNREIADIFETVSDMLQLKGENVHRVLAYRNASESIRAWPRDLRTMQREGASFNDIPNIGDTLSEKIIEMLDTGKLQFYDKLAAEVPKGMIDMMHINGVGPKKAQRFYKELGIHNVQELEQAAREGKLRDVSGMGAKTEANILAAIEALSRQTTRTPLGVAYPIAQSILERLLAMPNVLQGVAAGSIRRGRPTIGDVDLLVAVTSMDEAPPIMEAFVKMDEVERILGNGPTKSSVELHSGLQIDLRILAQERWGTALAYFTGSQAHNIRMRGLALDKGLSLNEHEFSDPQGEKEPILCATEEDVYAAVGLPYIAPELREDRGEIEAAQQGKLPKLITLEDIHADLHMHTTWSDGGLTVREMAEAALERGRKFIVITDHSRSLGMVGGLTIEQLWEQQAEIRQVDADMNGKIRVFHGTEMEIKGDGTLDYPDDVLEKLDFVIASLHVSLRQPREQITERLINAVNNPHVDLIGHPRGQYIPDREPADLDMDAVFAAAKDSGIALEINANPRRLDLEADYARLAVELGCLLAINTDAHAADNMDLMHYGVSTARRGWVEAKSVLNTWPLEKFLDWVQKRGR